MALQTGLKKRIEQGMNTADSLEEIMTAYQAEGRGLKRNISAAIDWDYHWRSGDFPLAADAVEGLENRNKIHRLRVRREHLTECWKRAARLLDDADARDDAWHNSAENERAPR